jgi:hypothetical protein
MNNEIRHDQMALYGSFFIFCRRILGVFWIEFRVTFASVGTVSQLRNRFYRRVDSIVVVFGLFFNVLHFCIHRHRLWQRLVVSQGGGSSSASGNFVFSHASLGVNASIRTPNANDLLDLV